MIEKGLYALLAGTSAVTAIVGTRIYPGKAAQNAGQRYVVYRRSFTEHRRNLRGSGSLKRATITVESFGANYNDAKTLAQAVYNAIGENGTSGVTWGGHAVRIARWEDETDEVIPPQMGDDAGVFSVLLDLVVWYAV